jgi:predicted permease
LSWLHGVAARMRLLIGRRAAEARMEEEIALHIEMETDRLRRERGLSLEEARRQALIAFGGIERHKEELREGRGLTWLAGLSLDLRLGVRMLVKHPGLTLVGVLGMSLGVAIGAVGFGIIYTLLDPGLPLDEGDRIVAIENVDRMRGDGAAARSHLHDLAVWRDQLSAVEELGAYRTVDRNLITSGGRPEGVRIAEMTASGFRIARVPPLLGRYLLDSDERPGAAPVVVIGHSVWQRRFAGDPGILGRTLRLGAAQHTIVGVMPPDFGFPVNNRVWTPLRLDPLDYVRGEAPTIEVFGRLARAATLQDARTQLTTIAGRLAAEYPETHAGIRTMVLPYSLSFIDSPDMAWIFHLVQVLVSLILVLIGANVAILVYARTANRAGEIAVRSALGASRGRIVAQLFAEALVLSATAAVVGLVFARSALIQVNAFVQRIGGEQLPFWMTFGLSPGLVLYVAGLAILAAVIVGVVPALKATRSRVHEGLQQLGFGRSGIRLGRTWTVLIVAQVAAAVAILPVSFDVIELLFHEQMTEPAFATRGMLAASVRLDREGFGTDDLDAYQAQEFRARFAQRQAELVRRLEAEPRVANVVLMDGLPGGDGTIPIEIEPASPQDGGRADSASAIHRVARDRVDPDYFDLFEIPVVAGRAFRPADVTASANVVIVSRAFVERVLGGGGAVGRRIQPVVIDEDGGWDGSGPGRSRTVRRTGPSQEIVGVVADVPAMFGDRRVRMYQPLLPEAAYPVRVVVRVRDADAASFAGTLRDLAVALDPMLRLEDVRALETSVHDNELLMRLAFLGAFGLTSSVLLLSAAGIYSLMSFTVARRRREIGIRSALGARPRLLVSGVLSKAMWQIGAGILAGAVLAALFTPLFGQQDYPVLRLALVAAFMALVGLAAASGPVLRALQIQPTEALKAE